MNEAGETAADRDAARAEVRRLKEEVERLTLGRKELESWKQIAAHQGAHADELQAEVRVLEVHLDEINHGGDRAALVAAWDRVRRLKTDVRQLEDEAHGLRVEEGRLQREVKELRHDRELLCAEVERLRALLPDGA